MEDAQKEKSQFQAQIEQLVLKLYTDYAMSVVTDRALPDTKDGLKPVQRRIMYGMTELAPYHGTFKKSARVVGDVLGKYHPHGDQSIYETAVHLVQPFACNLPLILGQGNFGSRDGDGAAAMRYTEIKLSKPAEFLSSDLPYQVVDFVPNYDGSIEEPTVLPTHWPVLLVNGATGIAVGIATNIPPHNLSEVIETCIAYIRNPEISVEEILKIMPGPDFPTGCLIIHTNGIQEYFRTGRGSVTVRSCVNIENNKLVITEIPYMINKTKIVAKIAELAKSGVIDGITNVRDESDRSDIRIVVEMKKTADVNAITNMLYKYAHLQINFSVNMMALNCGIPELLTVKKLIQIFIEFRQHIIVRRTKFKIAQAAKQANRTLGLLVALQNLGLVISTIRESPDLQSAKNALRSHRWVIDEELKLLAIKSLCNSNISDDVINLSEEQLDTILDMRLQRLVLLERAKILITMKELAEEIVQYHNLLNSRRLINQTIIDELLIFKNAFGHPRKTKIIFDSNSWNDEDMIQNKSMLLVLSTMGYIRRTSLANYKTQRLGGRGKLSISLKEHDNLTHVLVANMRDTLLIFTNKGRVYSTTIHRIPAFESIGSGKLLESVISIAENEQCAAILVCNEQTTKEYIVFATKKGMVKKHKFSDFAKVKTNGKIATNIKENDALVSVHLCSETDLIFLATQLGQCIKFQASDLRTMSSTNSYGVIGAKLSERDAISGMTITPFQDQSNYFVMTITDCGFVKATNSTKYRLTKRGAFGVKDMNTRHGSVIGFLTINKHSQIMAITQQGNVIRCNADNVRTSNRATQGVKLFNLVDDEKIVAAVAYIMSTETETIMPISQ